MTARTVSCGMGRAAPPGAFIGFCIAVSPGQPGCWHGWLDPATPLPASARHRRPRAAPGLLRVRRDARGARRAGRLPVADVAAKEAKDPLVEFQAMLVHVEAVAFGVVVER